MPLYSFEGKRPTVHPDAWIAPTATLVGDEVALIDPAEVSELGWFSFDELPDALAPPGTLEAVLAAVRSPERSRPR